MKIYTQPSTNQNPRAFSRVDLLVTLAIVITLIVIQLPLLGSTKSSSQATVCADNLRRLIQAWTMYADDNQERLVPNNGSLAPDDDRQTWVNGWLDFTSSLDNINTKFLVGSEQDRRYGLLGPYLKRDATVFRCPADRSRVTIFGRLSNRVRSYSMNNWMGGAAFNQETDFKVYHKLEDITRPNPSKAMVMVEEREDSLNDGVFSVDMSLLNIWGDFPASRHDGGMNLSYADGHVGFHPWQEQMIAAPVFSVPPPNSLLPGESQDGLPDLNFLRSVATAPR
ncbi:hypothetical protein GC207_11975 [bacterium]|nr:hypothetical protein [bacterium]